MSQKIVVLGPLPPPPSSISTHITRYIALLKSNGWEAAAVSYTGTTRHGGWGKLLEILEMFFTIYARVQPGAWDVLHVHYVGLGYFLGLAPLLKVSPGRKVLTFHSTPVIQDLPSWVRRLTLSLLNSFDLFVATDEGIGDDLRALGLAGPSITVMPAFLPPTDTESALELLPAPVAGKVLGYQGEGALQLCCAAHGLGPGGGQDDLYGVEALLAALADLDSTLGKPLVVWVLVSNGPDSQEREIADQAVRSASRGLKNIRVELHYGLPLMPVLARSQGFIRPSREDGDSVALREALWFGLPAVASDVVNRPEGVATFNFASREALAAELKKLIGFSESPREEETRSSTGKDQGPYRRFVAKVLGPGPTVNRFLKSALIHLPVLALLAALVFGSFGMVMRTPLWHPVDFQVLADAHLLVQDPGPMFRHIGFYFSQPALQLAFLAEYRLFGINPAGFIAVNLIIHTISSFLVYMLVNLLFPRRSMAVMAAVLFAFGVGSYGKIFMSVHQLESLLLASLHLMVLYAFIRNDHRRGGGLRSPFFLIGVFLFLLTGLTRNASFSLLGCLLAYKVFFNQGRGIRAILSPDLLAFMGIGILYYWAQGHWGHAQTVLFSESSIAKSFSLMSIKTIFRYLSLMFFPMQNTRLMEDVPFFVTWAFEARSIIRFLLTGAIVSYSFFGFVFGSKAVRFFIAWTFITLLPFTGITATGSWLNLNHLYLTSLGLCVILAAGVSGTSGLLNRRKWRRFIPYLIPLAFVLVSLVLTSRFDARNNRRAKTPEVLKMQQELEEATGVRG